MKGYKEFTKEFSRDNNVVPEDMVNKILCGSCIDILSKLPDNSVDLIFTSPPYNFDMKYDDHKDSVSWKDYFDNLFIILNECVRVIKYGGRVVINVQPLFSDYIPIHHIISKWFIDNGLIWKAEILWEKNNRNCAYTAWGSWKSPSSPYFKYTWEFLEVFCKGELKHTGSKELIDITSNEFKTWVDAKWSIAPERNMKLYEHPAMFPVELPYRVLKLFSFQEDIILDPFNGVGTTTFVAHNTNRRYIGIDISGEYCKKAIDRIKNEKMKDFAKFLDDKLCKIDNEKNNDKSNFNLFFYEKTIDTTLE